MGADTIMSGGGNMGALQVGMLRALAERDIKPDLVLGCSVGALNGAAYAADPTVAGVDRLEDLWLPCFCVTANLSRAALHVHERGPIWKYTRATTSLPGVLPPVVDGGELSGVLSMRDIVRLREVQDLASEGLNLAGIQRVLELQAEVEMLRNRLAQHEREKTSTALVVWRPQRRR